MIEKLYQLIKEEESTLIKASDAIWEYAEVGFDTPKSSAHLAGVLASYGFEVEVGVGNVVHAILGKYENGGVKIGFLGEFDALFGMSQKADALIKEPIVKGESGHGCGHNLLGVGSLAGAIGLMRYLKENNLAGSVYYYGCPAEESGSGKAHMAKAGVFDGMDVCLSWHPHYVNQTWSDRTLAVMEVDFEFEGLTSHAAAMPEMGRSALDGAEMMNIGVNFLREHMSSDARIHYAFLNAGGEAANVVQDFAKLHYVIRESNAEKVKALYERVVSISKGAALMSETTVRHEIVAACKDVAPNYALSKALYDNMVAFDFNYSKEALEFAQALSPQNKQVSLEVLPFTFNELTYASTDVGDVSWQVPVAQAFVACEPHGTPMHSWQWVSNGKSKMAHASLSYVGALLAKTGLDVILDGALLKTIKDEFETQVVPKRQPSLLP